MKVLVTGGAGYIGSHTAQKLRELNYDVVIYDNLSNGFESSALGGELIVADLNDKQALSDTFNRHHFDAVMHFAASIYSDESVAKPLEYYSNNITSLLSVLRECQRCGVRYFVFSSSASVYKLTTEAVSEDMPLQPLSPYGWSKMMGEQILFDEQKARDLKCANLRYFNAAGADAKGRLGNSGAARHLIKVSLQAALGVIDGITIYGTDYDTPDGTCIRDYIHVDDLAQIHADALEYLYKQDESLLLNCGYGHGYSVKEIIAAVKQVTGVDFVVREGERRLGDPLFLVANNKHLRSALRWTPAYDNIETIVSNAWEWEKKLQAKSRS